jgi:hypothetical protein
MRDREREAWTQYVRQLEAAKKAKPPRRKKPNAALAQREEDERALDELTGEKQP